MLVKHIAAYTHLSSTVNELPRYWSEIPTFSYPPWTIFVIFGGWFAGWPDYNMVQNIPEKLNPVSRVHITDDRRHTDGFAMPIAKRNVVTFG